LYADPDPDGPLMTFLKTDTARLRALILIDDLLYVNVMWGLVNLLPIFPLDGGNIAREFLTITRPRDALRISLWLSVFTAGLMAAYVAIELKQVFLALFFGYLAYTSYTAIQAYFGPGGGYGGGEQRWR
jgi:Zn-dependent protease